MSDKNNKDYNSEEFITKLKTFKKQEMISFRNLQNIDLTTYNNIFANFYFSDILIEDFDSFLKLLDNIKNEFKPELLKFYDIQTIKNDGKFSFNKFNSY